jgi:hypothetical protein
MSSMLSFAVAERGERVAKYIVRRGLGIRGQLAPDLVPDIRREVNGHGKDSEWFLLQFYRRSTGAIKESIGRAIEGGNDSRPPINLGLIWSPKLTLFQMHEVNAAA